MEIILTDEGTLVRRTASGEEVFDFNGQYRGLYPKCRFTAVARCKSGFYLAGLDDTNLAHLFCSVSGSTWVETAIAPQTHPELPAQCGIILSILEAPGDPPVSGVRKRLCHHPARLPQMRERERLPGEISFRFHS